MKRTSLKIPRLRKERYGRARRSPVNGQDEALVQSFMWYEALLEGRTWASLWSGYIRCPTCLGIRKVDEGCQACGKPMPEPEVREIQTADGPKQVPQAIYMGAEGRYEDYVYLQIIEQEWKRNITPADSFLSISASHRPSPRAVLAIVFWAYFETRIDRLLREIMRAIPKSVVEELLQRYSSIGSRLDRLYRLLFSTTYWDDLSSLGFGPVADLLRRLQQKRNDFAHGHPEAIDDKLIEDLVRLLKDEHEGWIAVFNKRAAPAIPLPV